MHYQYDLISNKVVRMSQAKLQYPFGFHVIFEDYMAQWYSYDGDKRLTRVRSNYAATGQSILS